MRALNLSIILLSVGASGCENGAFNAAQPSLIGGSPLPASEATGIVYLRDVLCSAVILNPWQLLTAGHCAERTPGTFQLRAGQTIQIVGFTGHPWNWEQKLFEVEVSSVDIHPSWHDALAQLGGPDEVADLPTTSDLALVTLAKKLPEIGVALVPANAAKVGVTARLEGCGCRVQGLSPSGVPDFARLRIIRVEEARAVVSVKNLVGQQDAGVCTGDSGGGAFADDSGSQAKVLLGVISTTLVQKPGQSPSQALPSVYARVDIEPVTNWLTEIRGRTNEPTEVATDTLPATVYDAIDEARQAQGPLGMKKSNVALFLTMDQTLVEKIPAERRGEIVDLLFLRENIGKASKTIIGNFLDDTPGI